MKALWKGNISFALVNIPVKLYGATRRRDIEFHILHKRCSTPLHYERYCTNCGVEVDWEDTVHGYEYEKGKFVVITEEEMEHLPVKSSKSIDIMRFIDPFDVDPLYYDRSYYLEPLEGGERAYALLRETMRASNKVGLAKITLKEREHVTVIRLHHDTIVLQTLFYHEEIANPEALNIPKRVSLDPQELALARELLQHFTGRFNIEAYHDEYRESLMDLIRAKIAGKEVKIAPRKEVERVINLMDALKRSLEKKRKRG